MKGANVFYVIKYKGNRNENPLFISEHTYHMVFLGPHSSTWYHLLHYFNTKIP